MAVCEIWDILTNFEITLSDAQGDFKIDIKITWVAYPKSPSQS